MASYRVLIKPSAVKELEGIAIADRRRLVRRIERLARDPRPSGVQKLSGLERFRLRQGDYRIVYSVDDSESIILIVKIGHRREKCR